MKREQITDPGWGLKGAGQAIESYYEILDYVVSNLDFPLYDLKKDLPELYQHFVNVFEVLKQARGWDD